jgi:tetratricopeptide (TPR) repeat protein
MSNGTPLMLRMAGWLVLSVLVAFGQGAKPLEELLTIEDPVARIAALESFLTPRTGASDRQTVREAIVASHAQLAERQLRENNIERAVRHFRDAIDRLPEVIPDPFFLSTVIRIPQATSMRGYRAEAILLARLLEGQRVVARDARQLGALGEYYLTIEASPEAIRVLLDALRIDPAAIELRRLLAGAYRMSLQLDDAVATYQRILGQAPADGRALYELANLYRAHGAYEEAMTLYQRRLSEEPRHEPSLKGLALSHLALGDPQEKGKATLAQLGEEATRDIYLQTQLAFLYLIETQVGQARLREAREAADAALTLEPRYAWARLAAAEVALAEERYLDAERHLLTALSYASFPTLRWTLGKVYLAVDDVEGALEQFAQAFRLLPTGEFEATLGGVRVVRTETLRTLLAREHQAAIFLAESPTSREIFRISETLLRLEAGLQQWRTQQEGGKGTGTDLDRSALQRLVDQFVKATPDRQPFRALYAAQRLIEGGTLLDQAIALCRQVLDEVEQAIESPGSLRDYPNYDREGRGRILRGRAWDQKGWAYFKAENLDAAEAALLEAILSYGDLPEVRRAFWHLATVRETKGSREEALALYVAGYEAIALPSEKTGAGQVGGASRKGDVKRTIVELLYQQVRGSLDGLDAALQRAANDPYEGLTGVVGIVPPRRREEAAAPSTVIAEQRTPGEELLIVRPRASAKDEEKSSSGFLLPRTDPMFAKRGEEAPPSPPQTDRRTDRQEDRRPAPPAAIPVARTSPPAAAVSRGLAAPEPTRNEMAPPPVLPSVAEAKPVLRRAIELPVMIPLPFTLDDPLTPFFNQSRYFSQWKDLRLVSMESPPPPPASDEGVERRPATRPRWVTRELPPPKGIE